MLNRLKRKFITLNIVCVTIILALVFVAICIVTYRTERENVIRELHLATEKIVFSENRDDSADMLFGNDETAFPTLTFFTDATGGITETYTGTTPSEPKPVLSVVAKRIAESDKSEGILFDYSLVYAKGQIGGKSYASITSLEILTDNVRTITRISGIILFSCLLLFLALSYFLASVAIKPVKATWDGQKQFIADASHDMKTPLTVILANTEIIKSHGGRVEDASKWLSSTKSEAERMKRLVDSMLELSSTEVSDVKIILYDTNLSEISERTALQMEAVAFEKSVEIKSRIENGIIIKGNEDKLSRLLHILIDNGIKYSLPNSALFITLERGRRFARLSVINNGTYIKNEDIPHLFERFYRGDKARSGGDGFGLGLAIAKNLTESMGGTIRAENKEGVGAVFTASFPLSERLLAKIFYQRRSGKRL